MKIVRSALDRSTIIYSDMLTDWVHPAKRIMLLFIGYWIIDGIQRRVDQTYFALPSAPVQPQLNRVCVCVLALVDISNEIVVCHDAALRCWPALSSLVAGAIDTPTYNQYWLTCVSLCRNQTSKLDPKSSRVREHTNVKRRRPHIQVSAGQMTGVCMRSSYYLFICPLRTSARVCGGWVLHSSIPGYSCYSMGSPYTVLPVHRGECTRIYFECFCVCNIFQRSKS